MPQVSPTAAGAIAALGGLPRPTSGTEPTAKQQAQERVIAAAAKLIDDRHFQIFNQDEVPSAELIARILCARQMLTSPELLRALIDNDHSILSTLYASAVADVERMTRHVAALQQIATVLLNQVDEVSTLAAVTKTRKGQQMVEQARIARTLYGQASERYSERARPPRSAAVEGGAA